MKTLKNLISEINEALSKFDEQIIESDVEAMRKASERVQAYKKEARESGESKDQWKYYDKLFALAGGKGNFHLIQYGFNKDVEEKVRKLSKDKIESRNAKIAAKLMKLGEDSVIESGEMIYSNDGFNGVFKVGDKKVIIETIYAGGYNVQCLHLRCLVKIK